MHKRNRSDGGAPAGSKVAEGIPALAYEADGRHFLDYLRVLYKRRWLAGTVFLLVFVSAFIFAVTATPIYEATVRLQIETEAPDVVNFREVVAERRLALRSEYYRTQYEILRSRSLARTTMDRLALWDDPAFTDDAQVFNPVAWGLALARRAVTLPVRFIAGLVTPEPEDGLVATAEIRAESLALDRFLARLTVTPVRDSRIVDIRFRSTIPTQSAEMANALGRAYIDQDLAFRHTSSLDASHWLRQRIAEQREQVEGAELAMQRYRETHGAISLDERQNVIGQELADLNEAATRATTERIGKEARYREMLSVQDDPAALDRFPEILRNAFIQQQKMRLTDLRRDESGLAQELGDLHPDMINIRSAVREAELNLRAEIAMIVDSVRTDFEIARNQESQLQAALQRQTGDALALDRAGIEYGVLTREADSARRIYESLLRRADETGITSELQTSGIRIVDEAEVPSRPSRPRRARMVLFGLVGGALLAIALVFFIDYLDNRVKTPEDVRQFLGRPYLGMLPKVSRSGQKLLQIESGVPENFASAIRTIRTSLFFSSAEEGCRSVVVTSAEPGEGKSVLACNLATSIAQSGQRTLLVDADLRRPRVHEYRQQKREPGLSDMVVGQSAGEATIRKSDSEGLWLLTAGTESPNPTELLASRRFGSFLASQDKKFDWIVFDTPPVMPIADATIIAHGADHVVFVVDAEATNRRTAATALERLTESGARVVGVVLNKVDLDGHPYYYSQYYRRDYRRYYQHA